MKILFLQKMAGISGSERYLLNILPALKKRNFDVSFLILQQRNINSINDSFKKTLISEGIKVYSINSNFLLNPYSIYKLFQIIKQNNFNVLHTNLVHADLLGALYKKFIRPSIKLLSTKHGYTEKFQARYSFDHTKIKHDLFYYSSKWAAKYADKVVCISKSLENFYFNSKIVERHKLETIPYGFDFNDLPSPNGKDRYNFGSPQLIITGRLEPVKQHHLLLEILPNLKSRFPDLSVVMVGDGSLKQSLQKRCFELSIDNIVHWVGFQENVHSFISSSDLMIIPSRSEGFGLVILEAWHHAKPVIGFDVPALNDIIESGKDGILVEPFSKSSLLKAALEMLSDPEKMKFLGKSGQTKQKEYFGMDRMVDLTINVLEKLVYKNQNLKMDSS